MLCAAFVPSAESVETLFTPFVTPCIIVFVCLFILPASSSSTVNSPSKFNWKSTYVDTLISNHLSGGVMRVIESISNGVTFRVLCVICSILVLTHFSPTSHMPLLTIHNIFATVPTTLSVVEIAGERRGTLGAGGNVGRLSSIDGMKDGSSGSFGGAGNCGIDGIDHKPQIANLPFCEL